MLVVPTEKLSRFFLPPFKFGFPLTFVVMIRCSPLEAELWGILDGILILLSKGYKKVQIQTDNLEVVRVLSMEETEDSGITLLRRVKRLLRSKGQWDVKYVPRECNLIADQLAKISLSWQAPLSVFEVPPDLVATVIQKEKAFRAL
ncbi:hypothetical protein J1N35_010335 [Gossypium stocksii]|uniref:RNase H type-1 domain-containing protein n=1 Tax=Gossypium stocksii TaxID=47602 RepID=A0A9D3W0T3_9ROSI|nr:hypothetical protein J1N35_010335 [Gossypium stocksii]